MAPAEPVASWETRTDLELHEGVRAGDEAAFTVLYERYFRRVQNFAYSRVHNRADAEDVVQETFTVVFRSPEAFGGRSSLLSWIYGIAKNVANNHIRRARAYSQRLEHAEEVTRSGRAIDMCTPEDSLNLSRCAAVAASSLESVSEWQAVAFSMRHFEDLSVHEIADRMSRSNDAIRSSLCRVKRLMVEAVDSERVNAG